MPEMNKLTSSPKRELDVFYVLDISGSMMGDKIGALNRAMEECKDALTTLARSNSDAVVKIAVLTFSTGCRWITVNGPEAMEDFEWEDLEAGGLTDMGAALNELNSKLCQKEFLNSMTGSFLPVIIFMTDGHATDTYENALEEIRRNKWFRRGTKIGFALGDDADIKMISSVVGNSEAVIRTTDLTAFGKLMSFVAVTSSMLNSVTQPMGVEANGEIVVTKAGEEVGGFTTGGLPDGTYNPEPKPTQEEEEKWEGDED